jgi:hypothetical protein
MFMAIGKLDRVVPATDLLARASRGPCGGRARDVVGKGWAHALALAWQGGSLGPMQSPARGSWLVRAPSSRLAWWVGLFGPHAVA